MTFLEAAEAVLKESGAPLHYKEITARALQKGLIESSGKTPEATMGALLYTAVAKAKEQGVSGTFRPAGKAHFGLALSAVGGAVQASIEAQNKKVARELLDFLHEMHPRQLELIVGRLLEEIGFDVKVTQYSGDGGIDVDAVLTVGGVTKVRTAIQVKRFKERANVGVKFVRELRGSLVTDQRGLIITTSKFAEGAKEEAEAQSKTPISLIDGERLVQLLMQHEIGAERELVPLYKVKLDDLLTEEPDDDGSAGKSASLQSLPGGQESFFESLLAFLDEIGAKKPTLGELTEWVLATFESVTKQKVVESYVRAVLSPLGLIEFDGDRIVLTAEGEDLRSKRERAILLDLLKKNITGVEELLALLAKGPASIEAAHEHLLKTIGVKWDTDMQVRFRLQWLSASAAVVRDGKTWRLQG